jgi:hypothetical protein
MPVFVAFVWPRLPLLEYSIPIKTCEHALKINRQKQLQKWNDQRLASGKSAISESVLQFNQWNANRPLHSR